MSPRHDLFEVEMNIYDCEISLLGGHFICTLVRLSINLLIWNLRKTISVVKPLLYNTTSHCCIILR